MAKARQLQNEIAKTLKEVEEGCENFNSTFLKIEHAVTQTEKERFEQELKKEIKKLQRLRESIRNFQTNTDIRDKQLINESRNKIEELMATYKNYEKENKTKAFSREGLEIGGKIDPKEEEKERSREWIRNIQQNLKDSINDHESELELLRATRGRKIDISKIENLTIQLHSYNFHYEKLEQILRALENDMLDIEKLNEIKELYEIFVEETEQQEYIAAELEEMYKELDLSGASVTFTSPVVILEEEKEEETKKKKKKPEPPKPTPKLETKAQEIPRAESVWTKEDPIKIIEEPKSDDENEVWEHQDLENARRALDESYSFLIRAEERERSELLIVKNYHQGHPSYPQKALFTHTDQYEKLELDTLFFIFYHQPGSYEQYLAAKELKKREWIFHKRFETWFERYGELKVTAQDREKGSYVYFDYETNWSERKKTDFEFEYTFLENELV